MAKKTKKASRKPAKTKGKRFRILSLDGGGIRGTIAAYWLKALEDRLKAPAREHFDLIAGTSTGAILACAISSGIPASKIVSLYQDFGREVFPSTGSRLWSRASRMFSQGFSAPKYDGKGLERALKRQFGNATFGSLAKPTIVTAYDTLTRQPVVMKTMGAAATERKQFDSVRVWEVVKASSSAPTYLPAHVLRVGGVRMPLIDGGVVANNPTACAVAEAVRINRKGRVKDLVKLEEFVVASFGTGESTRSISISEAGEWGALEWALPIIDVLFDGAGDSVDYIARHLLTEDRYVRLQTRLDDAYDDLDNASKTNINALLRLADGYLTSGGGDKQLQKLVGLIR